MAYSNVIIVKKFCLLASLKCKTNVTFNLAGLNFGANAIRRNNSLMNLSRTDVRYFEV